MVVDTSVFIAAMANEPDYERYLAALLRASNRTMSAGNYLECAIVVQGRRLGAREDLDDWLNLREITVLPVDLGVARLAADAFDRYGKGRHRAGLNYGDCFAYALAKSLRAPLLYKSNDFALTDIEPALAA